MQVEKGVWKKVLVLTDLLGVGYNPQKESGLISFTYPL